MGTARRDLAGAGIQTAGLAFGGFITAPTDATEEYDGTSWTTGGSLGTSRYRLSGFGTQDAGLACGGSPTPISNQAKTELYNGSTWSETSDLATARRDMGAAGTQPAGVAFGGAATDITNITEEFTSSANVITGAACSSGGNLNTARWSLGQIGSSVNDYFWFGGYAQPPSYAVAETYNGTSWSEVSDMNQARYAMGHSGTTSAALAVGGGSPNGAINLLTTLKNGMVLLGQLLVIIQQPVKLEELLEHKHQR